MLVYHGTAADKPLLAKLAREGFTPQPRPWAHETTGIEAHVFACTQPIGTRGGDPIAFAQRGAWRDARATLFVFDVEPSEIHGAVPNGELELWWKLRSFVEQPWSAGLFASRQPMRERLRYRLNTVEPDLCDAPDAHSLVQFEAAYHRARPTEKARVARSYGLRIPAWFADDMHSPDCMGCMHQLFDVDIEVRDADLTFQRGAWDRLDLTMLGQFLDATGRWLAHAGNPDVTTLAQLQRYPAPPDVPRVMRKDFVTADLAARMRGDDTQVLLGHVPPSKIVGTIDLGTHDRLSPLVRPTRGQTLLGNLRHRIREL